jgi:hypothetical protein
MCHWQPVAVIAGLVLAACASQTAKQVDDAGAASTELTEEALLAAQAAGYSLVTRNGEQVLCRRDAQTGTRLGHTTTCLTARDWARARSSSRKALEDATRGQKPACSLEGNC